MWSEFVRSGKESEKKEWGPFGNVDMTWRIRGVLVDGHMELQIFVQSAS